MLRAAQGKHKLGEIPSSRFTPPTDAYELMKSAIGYASSKWAGEVLLERAIDVPPVVHRFQDIFGPDVPAEIQLLALNR